MRSWLPVMVVVAGCAQQDPAGRLDPGGPVVLAPESLKKAPPLDAVDALAYAAPVEPQRPPPLSATSQLNTVPPLATSITQVRQLTVAFELQGAGAPSVAAVEFLNPSGAPYERQEAPISGSAFASHHLEFVINFLIFLKKKKHNQIILIGMIILKLQLK